MRIAIFSDIHDNIWTLQAALRWVQDADALICCGDLCSPFMIDRLANGFSGPIHIVFGNNDGDRFRMTQNAARFAHVKLWGEFAAIPPELTDGRRFAVTHWPVLAEPLAASGLYDVVCYGHDHQLAQRRVGATLVINPGELMGGLTGSATFVAYDTERDAVSTYEVTYIPFAADGSGNGKKAAEPAGDAESAAPAEARGS